MILVAGGTGLLGRQVVHRLVGRGAAVRVLTRDAGRSRAALDGLGTDVELVAGDVRTRASLPAALEGVSTVVAAVQGFGGRDPGGIAAVDRDGNRNLIAAAAEAGVARFVLISIHDASDHDPLALGRAKAVAERDLHASGMDSRIVRPTAYMETWAGIVGDPILATGRARVFGRGANPINFVASADVVPVVEELVVADDPAARTVEVVGPEDLSFDDVVHRFAVELGRPVSVSHVPTAVLRVMAVGLRAVRPVLADQVAAAVVLDTTDRRAGVDARAGADVRRGETTFAAVIADLLRVRAVEPAKPLPMA